MDSLFYVSTSQSNNTPKSAHEDAQMTEDIDQDSSRGESSSLSRTDIQEQQSSIDCSSSIDDISRRAQDLVEKINARRINDQKLIDNFQEKIVEKVTEMCQHMKEHMYTIYEVNTNEMQVKLQELSQVLENCAKLNKELMEARRALAGLTESLASSQTSEL